MHKRQWTLGQGAHEVAAHLVRLDLGHYLSDFVIQRLLFPRPLRLQRALRSTTRPMLVVCSSLLGPKTRARGFATMLSDTVVYRVWLFIA